MLFTKIFRTAAVIATLSGSAFSLTTESKEIISGIESAVEQAHKVADSIKSFDGGMKSAISVAQAFYNGQKASSGLQSSLNEADPIAAEDVPQFLAALGNLNTAIVDATKAAGSQV
jgi:hypothetical protein